QEVVSTKYIQDNNQSNWTTVGINTDENADFEYRLNIRNFLKSEVKDLIIYDVFPHVGDQSIVSNQDGLYLPRESDFENKLTGPIVLESGFTAYYSTDSIIED